MVSWKLTLLMLAVVPVVGVLAAVYGHYLEKLSNKFQDALGKANTVAEEAISSVRTVRSFNREYKTQEEYALRIEDSYQIGKKQALATGGFMGVTYLLSYTSILLVLWLGGKMVLENEISDQVLISFILYTISIAFSFAFVSSVFGGECVPKFFKTVHLNS